MCAVLHDLVCEGGVALSVVRLRAYKITLAPAMDSAALEGSSMSTLRGRKPVPGLFGEGLSIVHAPAGSEHVARQAFRQRGANRTPDGTVATDYHLTV